MSEINTYISKKVELQNLLLSFLDEENDIDEKYQNLISNLANSKIQDNKYELLNFLILISKLVKNHHRHENFIQRVEQLLHYLQQSIKSTFTNTEIYSIFKNNKRCLYFLITNEIIEMNSEIAALILNKKVKITLSCIIFGTKTCHSNKYFKRIILDKNCSWCVRNDFLCLFNCILY